MSGYLTKVVIKRLVNCTAVSNHVTQRRLGSLAFLFLFFFLVERLVALGSRDVVSIREPSQKP